MAVIEILIEKNTTHKVAMTLFQRFDIVQSLIDESPGEFLHLSALVFLK